jgi:hypothetical protein
MSKKEALQIRAEDLVRKILVETFGQKMDNGVITTTAAKVARVVPAKRLHSHSVKAQISSSDQT